jgi:hypothetical protein
MDPIIFEFLGGLLVGTMAGLMVVLRIGRVSPSPENFAHEGSDYRDLRQDEKEGQDENT